MTSHDGASADTKQTVRVAVHELLGRRADAITEMGSAAGRQVYLVDVDDREVVFKVLDVSDPRSTGCGYTIDAMLDAGVPTPRVLAVDTSGTYFENPLAIFEFAQGITIAEWQLSSKPSVIEVNSALRDLGRHVRQMHEIVTPKGFGPLTDDGVGKYTSWPQALIRKRQRMMSGQRLLTLDVRGLAAAGVITEPLAEEIEQVVDATLPRIDRPEPNLVHNDITLKNVLIDPARCKVTAILDLHNALGGDPLLDLARFQYFYRGRGWVDPFLDGYGPEPREQLDLVAFYAVVVTLEKLMWLKGREERFPDRADRDLTFLRETLDVLAGQDRSGAG